MGLSVVLEDEHGLRVDGVDDQENVLRRLLPSPDDTKSSFLKYVDWYGDTVFNRKQIIDVIEELRLLSDKNPSDNERILICQIIRLAERVKCEAHLYLKFYGD